MCNCYWAKGTSTRRVREQFLATTSRHYSFCYWENACPTKMFCWPVVSLQNRRLGAESVDVPLKTWKPNHWIWKMGCLLEMVTGSMNTCAAFRSPNANIHRSCAEVRPFPKNCHAKVVDLLGKYVVASSCLVLWSGSSGSQMTRFTYSFTNRCGDNHW